MKQYIDKDVITAEIERRYKINLIGAHGAFRNGKIEALREIKDFLNTIEINEVDLEEEATQYHEDIKNAFKAGFELGTTLHRKEE